MSDRNNKFDNYYGSKGGSGVCQQIINQIRPHTDYMELFAGTAVIYRNKYRSEFAFLNDIDEEVYSYLCGTFSECGRVIVGNWNAIEFLDNCNFRNDRKYCIYLDPPYPIGSRKNAIEVYRHEMTDDDHRQLLSVVTRIGKLPNVDILISTYKNPIYEEYLADWRLITFAARTRTYTATEYLYMNYPEPTELHDYRYIGKDFTDRQRIARKIDRKVKQLLSMNDLERNAIIHAISNI